MAASTSSVVDSSNCFDVFINHRGPDVKKTFASHLYRRLISYGLRVFLDYQEMQEGEDLNRQIQGAIKTASVHVAIFTPKYAASNWCLDELVLMLESEAPIIPVFHNVKPTDLRRTQGEGVYAESLRNLEKKRPHESQPRYTSDTIEKWRNALSRVADISGLELETFDGDEGELVDKVVEVVLKKDRNTRLDVARHPTGLDEMVEDFKTKVSLHQHSGTVQIVGITGLGGAGKTTLAKELFNRNRSNYSKSCFLFDVRENAKNSLPSLQRTLLKCLSPSEQPIDSKDGGIEMLKKHFRVLSSPVLLVLDDVDHQDQVYALLPVTDKPLPPNSLILITSRDKDVLARSGVQKPSIYQLTGLNTQRSKELFCWHAFCQPHPLSGFEHLVDQFLTACNGLPLSLKVFGAHLCGNNDASYWEDELEELRKTLPEEIQKRLQISYDALKPEEKEIFLDIACFFIGENRDTAIRVWDGSGWKGLRGFQSLQNKCLVEPDVEFNRLGVKTGNFIRMHDHLRDMGRELAKHPGRPLRLWDGTKNIDDLSQQSSETTPVRGIRMLRPVWYQTGYASSDDDDERASFSRYKMNNLRLLDVGIGIKEDLLKCLLEGVDSSNLLWFRWRKCPCSSLPPILMKQLRVLEVSGSDLKTLWPEELQAPLQLRELRIHAPLSQIPKSIGQLKRLERMVVVTSSSVQIPDEFGDLRSLKHLQLRSSEMRSLPDSFGNLSTLEHIDLSQSVRLERLPDSFCNLIKLKYLDLSDCRDLTLSSGTFGKINTLEYIGLFKCPKIEVLPSQIAHQCSLEKLHLMLENLKEWPSSTGEPSGLEKLVLETPLLKTLPPSLGRDLRNLKYLELRSCTSLKRLPDSFLLLNQLSEWTVKDCPLQELPFKTVEGESETWMSNLDRCLLRLQHLKLYGTQISEVSFPTGVCPDLQHLDIRDCQDLVEVGTLPNALITLQLIRCPKLRKRERLCGFAKLQTLDVSRCNEVEELHFKAVEGESETLTGSGHLLRLQHLELDGTQISEVSFPTGVCPDLQHLDIRDCQDLVEVGTLPNALIKLQLIRCPKLRKIEQLCGFAKLQTLDVSRCKEVEELSSFEGKSETLTESRGQRALSNLDCSFDKRLLRLQHLKLHGTQISEVLFPTDVCPNLQHLDIRDCEDLVEVGTLPNALIKLQLIGCPKLRKIGRLCGFAKLQTLDVSRCKEMEDLPSSEGKSETLTESRGQRALSNLDCSFDKRLLRLQHLELHNTQISGVLFPTDVCPNLQHLDIGDCQDLVEVGTLPNALIQLELKGCPKLRKIGRLYGFAKLQTLDVSRRKEVEELQSIEGKSETLTQSRGQRALSNLELYNTEISEVSFPTGVCPNLQYLSIKHGHSLVEFRTSLKLRYCHKLRKIELCGLAKLQILDVAWCIGVEELSGMETLVSLEKLDVFWCPKLKSIPGLAQLTNLRELNIFSCYDLEELPSVEHLKSLEKMLVRFCVKLKTIRGLEQLTQLGELNVSYCCELEELPGVEHLRSLVVLRACNCMKLKGIRGSAQMTLLEELDVSDCFELEELTGVEHLKSLIRLQARRCNKLKIIQGLAQLTRLRELDVSGFED